MTAFSFSPIIEQTSQRQERLVDETVDTLDTEGACGDEDDGKGVETSDNDGLRDGFVSFVVGVEAVGNGESDEQDGKLDAEVSVENVTSPSSCGFRDPKFSGLPGCIQEL